MNANLSSQPEAEARDSVVIDVDGPNIPVSAARS